MAADSRFSGRSRAATCRQTALGAKIESTSGLRWA
jgi:hypothetical protein